MPKAECVLAGVTGHGPCGGRKSLVCIVHRDVALGGRWNPKTFERKASGPGGNPPEDITSHALDGDLRTASGLRRQGRTSMTQFSAHHLPDFQAIRELPAIRKVLDGVELNEADKMALELRVAEIESATLGDGGPYLSAAYKAANAGFMPRESLGGGYVCNDTDFAYMAAEHAADTLQKYRRLKGADRRGRLRLADDQDFLHEFLSLRAELQYIAGNLLNLEDGWDDFSDPDVIVAEYIERFYSGVHDDNAAGKELVLMLGKHFRQGQEQAAVECPNDRHVMVTYKRKDRSGAEGVFKMETYLGVHSALGAIHGAYDDADDERDLSNVELAFAEGEFLSSAHGMPNRMMEAENNELVEF